MFWWQCMSNPIKQCAQINLNKQRNQMLETYLHNRHIYTLQCQKVSGILRYDYALHIGPWLNYYVIVLPKEQRSRPPANFFLLLQQTTLLKEKQFADAEIFKQNVTKQLKELPALRCQNSSTVSITVYFVYNYTMSYYLLSLLCTNIL